MIEGWNEYDNKSNTNGMCNDRVNIIVKIESE